MFKGSDPLKTQPRIYPDMPLTWVNYLYGRLWDGA